MTSAFGEGPVCLLRDLLRPSLDPIPFRLDRLASTQEADGTLLDHSLFLYGASLSNPNLHAHYDLPLAVVGGDRRMQAGGRHLVFPPETPMTNLLLSLLDKIVMKRYPDAAALLRRLMREQGLPVPPSSQPGRNETG